LKNLTVEQAAKAPMRNVLTRCVGVAETVYPDLFFGTPKSGVTYMLCSDGFRHYVNEDELKCYLRPAGINGPEHTKHREAMLIELNKRRGETDNISVITIHAL